MQANHLKRKHHQVQGTIATRPQKKVKDISNSSIVRTTTSTSSVPSTQPSLTNVKSNQVEEEIDDLLCSRIEELSILSGTVDNERLCITGNMNDDQLHLLESFYSLKELKLSGMNLEDKHFEALSNIYSLTKLDISGTTNSAKPNIYTLQYLHNLEEIILPNSKMAFLATKYCHPLIRKFTLSNGNGNGIHLANIERFTLLEHLDIRGACLGNEAPFYISKMTKLKTLILRNNLIGVGGAEYIAKVPSLTHLDVSNNNIGDEGVYHLTDLSKLNTLIISFNGITSKGARYISSMSSLTHLGISGNIINNDGAQFISNMNTLSELDISKCGLDNQGINIIGKMKFLKYLDLSHSSIQISGAKTISRLQNLSTLKVSNMFFPKECILAICEMKNLTCLEMDNSGLFGGIANHLFKLQNLTRLSIRQNNFSEWDHDSIREALPKLKQFIVK